MFFSPLKMTFWAKHMSGHWVRVKQRCDVTGCIHVAKKRNCYLIFSTFVVHISINDSVLSLDFCSDISQLCSADVGEGHRVFS